MSDDQRKYARRYIVDSVTNFQNYWRRLEIDKGGLSLEESERLSKILDVLSDEAMRFINEFKLDK